MKFVLSKREQRSIFVLIVLVAVIGWVYVTYILAPLNRESSSLEEQVKVAREQLRALEAATQNEPALQAKYQELDRSVLSLKKALPPEEELPAIIEFLSDLANQAQVKIQTISPQRSANADAGVEAGKPQVGGEMKRLVYTEIPIQIDALAGYHQLGAFLSRVESSGKPMRISNLRISGNSREPKRHQIKLLIEAYFAAGGSSSTGKRQARLPD